MDKFRIFDIRVPSPYQTRSTTFRITSQQISPRDQTLSNNSRQQMVTSPRESIHILTTPNTPRQAIRQHKTQMSEVESRVFWNAVSDRNSLATIQPNLKSQTGLELRKRIYTKLKQEQHLKQQAIIDEDNRKRLILEQQLREEAEIQKRKEIQEKRRLMEVKNKAELAELWKYNRRCTLYNVVNAVLLQKLHSGSGSFKLTKLIAKHYLSILNYKGILRRIQQLSRKRLSINTSATLVTISFKEIQQKLNQGISKSRHDIGRGQNKSKSNCRNCIASEIFSENVLRLVRILQTCFRMQMFKLPTKLDDKKLPIKEPSPRTVNRMKAQKKRLSNVNYLEMNSPRSPAKKLVTSPQSGTLAIFSTIKAVSKFKDLGGRQQSQRILQISKDHQRFLIQQKYYPSIRYISVFYRNVVVWSVIYADITSDKTCIVLFFKGEGRQNYFYRLDVPITGSIQTTPNAITVWPTVKEYLQNYLTLRGQTVQQQYDQSHADPAHLGYLQHLPIRARRLISMEDIEGITIAKAILHYLQTTHIIRIRKIFGSICEMLPQFEGLIINLSLIHDVVLQIRNYEFQRNYTQQQLQQYLAFAKQNEEIINQIITFRFVVNSQAFYRNQTIEEMYKVSDRSILVQTSLFNIKEFSDEQHLQPLAMIAFYLQLKCSHVLDKLFSEPQFYNRKCQMLSKLDQNGVWQFNQKFFQAKIEITVFEKDSLNEQSTDQIIEKLDEQISFKPLLIELNHVKNIGRALQDTMNFYSDEILDFDILLKDILLEKKYYNNVIDLILKTAFAVQQNKVVLKSKYTHILSKTHNFIQQMDHKSLYNSVEQGNCYSIFPGEEKYLRNFTNTDKQLSQDIHFHELFQEIHNLNIRITDDSHKLTQFEQDYQDILIPEDKQTITCKIFDYTFNNLKFKFIFNVETLYIKMRKYQSIAKFEVNDKSLINKIMACSNLKYKQQTTLLGLIRQIVPSTCFLSHRFQLSYPIKQQLMSYNLIKLMLISQQQSLTKYLDKAELIYLCNSKFYAQVKVFYSNKERLAQDGTYQFDGEHLFVLLELYEMNSKMKKFLIVFNKYDLQQMFTIENEFDAHTINEWCNSIVQSITFQKRFLYRIPFFRKDFFTAPQSPIKIERPRIMNRSTLNEFSKFQFDSSVEKKFLNSIYKVFRVIAHFIEKMYFVKNREGKHSILTQTQVQQSKFQILQVQFCIITVLAHTQFDEFQIQYYFPKSKRKIMTQLNILSFQEMDFKDSILLETIDSLFKGDYKQVCRQFRQLSKKGNIRRKSYLDSKILKRMKFLRGKSPEISPTDAPVSKKRSFAEISNEAMQKNSVIKQCIKSNHLLAQLIMKFLNFTRSLNAQDQRQQFHYLEVRLWQQMLEQIFRLSIQEQNQYQSLYARIVDTFMTQSYKTIGKTYKIRRENVQNAYHTFKVRQELTQLYQDLMIQHSIKVLQPFAFSQTKYSVSSNYYQVPACEFLCSLQFKIERMGSAYIDCFLETLGKINILSSADPIPYSQSTNYNIYFRYYSLMNYNFRDNRVNLRELLNLFIADGFFKSQTNYMNSKLTRADIHIMCQYLTYKIKSQNFMNLSQLVLFASDEVLQENIILECQDQQTILQQPGEGYIYTFTLFRSQKKVVFNYFDSQQQYFKQSDLQYNYIISKVPFFKQLLQNNLFRQALHRLSLILTKKFNPRTINIS